MSRCDWQSCKRIARTVVLCLYFIGVLITVPVVIVELANHNAKEHVIAWVTGGVFTLGTLPICLWNIFSHLLYYTDPSLQRYIIRILWMVPIYTVSAWVGLRFPSIAIFFDIIRECYEAYVVYNFMAYLMTYLQLNYPDLDDHLKEKGPQSHLIPFCCCKHWPTGLSFLLRCKHGVLQYVVVRPLTTATAIICELAHVYEEGDFSFQNGWSYLVIINNISQFWALYCLVLFYKATKEELHPVKPIWKFGCVKAIIFLTFWQAVAIALLVKIGVISDKQTGLGFKSVQEVANGLQDLLICIEMLFIAVAFLYAFSYRPFIRDRTITLIDSLSSMWDVTDVRRDVSSHIHAVGSLLSFRRAATGQSEERPLLVKHRDDTSDSTPQYIELQEASKRGQQEEDTDVTVLWEEDDDEGEEVGSGGDGELTEQNNLATTGGGDLVVVDTVQMKDKQR